MSGETLQVEHLVVHALVCIDATPHICMNITTLQRDNKRGNYELKEAKLATALCKACSLDLKKNAAARHALEWKKPETINGGNFPAVMEEVQPEKA